MSYEYNLLALVSVIKHIVKNLDERLLKLDQRLLNLCSQRRRKQSRARLASGAVPKFWKNQKYVWRDAKHIFDFFKIWYFSKFRYFGKEQIILRMRDACAK